jgi:hypothetical protein
MVRVSTLWPDDTRREILVQPIQRGYRISRAALDSAKKRELRRAGTTKARLYSAMSPDMK